MENFSRQQEVIYKLIERSRINFKNAAEDRLTSAYVEVRLDNLKSCCKEFKDNDKTAYESFEFTEFNSSSYSVNFIYEKFCELCLEYEADLRDKLAIITAKVARQPSIHRDDEDCSQQIRLPKISIPNFSGNYAEWTTFRDLFVSLIHNNKALDDVQKLHYLKSYLVGEAEQLLRHIPVTAANYIVCWSLVEKRYSNKKYLCQEILKRLLGQKSLTEESARAIKGLLDTTNECLNSLQSIGIDTSSWDVLVIHIVSSKLDHETRKQWEAKSSEFKELAKFKQFNDFLELRFRSLEFLECRKEKPQVRAVKSLHVTAEVDEELVCPFCKDGHHTISRCKKFERQEVTTRCDFVQAKGLCTNCLGPSHFWYMCRDRSRCKKCNKKHNTLLHGSQFKKNYANSTSQVNTSHSEEQKYVVNNTNKKVLQDKVSPRSHYPEKGKVCHDCNNIRSYAKRNVFRRRDNRSDNNFKFEPKESCCLVKKCRWQGENWRDRGVTKLLPDTSVGN